MSKKWQNLLGKKKKKPLLRKRIRIKELQFHVRTGKEPTVVNFVLRNQYFLRVSSFIDDHRFFFLMLQSQKTGQFPLWKKNKSELKTRWFYLISRNWEWSGQVTNWRFIGGYLIVPFFKFIFQTMFFVLYQRQFFFCVTTMVMRSKNRPDAGEGLSQFLIPTPTLVLKIHMYIHLQPPSALATCLWYLPT